MNTELDEWTSWRVSLLRSCIPLCKNEKIQEVFKNLLKSLRKSEDSWQAEYINKELVEVQFQLMSLLSKEGDVQKFLEENLDNPAMRERIIESAMEQGDYERMVELATEGLKQAGYKIEAKNLIEDLLQMYGKRRAFVDELHRIS